MKKVLLTLIMSVVFGGTIFAQYYDNTEYYNPNGYDTYFNTAYEFNPGQYEDTDYPTLYLRCNGNTITTDDRWYDYEVGAFVNGVLRGFCFMTTMYVEMDYPLPMFDGIFVFFTNPGEQVNFKLYDHGTGIEYECTVNGDIVTGDDSNYYTPYDDPYGEMEETLYISFTADEGGYEKPIVGYGENEGGYYLLATPVKGARPAEIAGMTDGEFDLYYFDQTGGENGKEWKNYKNEAFGLVFGKGYLYAHDTDVTLNFMGSLYSGDGVFPLDYDANAELAGYNLVGNPFLEEAYVDLPFYVLNGAGAEVVPAEGSTVPAMEGCFVLATEEGQSVTFSTEAPGTKVSRLSLNLVNGTNLVDRAIVRFGEGIQLPKFQINSSSTKLYIPMDGSDYALVSSEEMGELPVNFKAGKSGSYTLTVTSEEVSFGYLHLIDNLTGADVDLLATPSYSFEANTTDYASRFTLVFATGNADDTFAFYSNGSFVINNEGEAALQVVDVTGRILSSETINGCANVSVDGAAGVYMIRLVNGENVKVQKVVVK